ncbi:MAG: hypothetical protein NTZ55_04390 [Candidatus Roizmanbacteria bacterium]|nr:hypothetical protein [Candidatus Roizmanbacteria bacterium]
MVSAEPARAPVEVQKQNQADLPMSAGGFQRIDRNSFISPKIGEPRADEISIPANRIQINHDKTHIVSAHLVKPTEAKAGQSVSRVELVRLNAEGTDIDSNNSDEDCVEGSMPINDDQVVRLLKDYAPQGGAEEDIVLESIASGASVAFKDGSEKINMSIAEWRIQSSISDLKREQMAEEARKANEMRLAAEKLADEKMRKSFIGRFIYGKSKDE